jgi:hypothetical protein
MPTVIGDCAKAPANFDLNFELKHRTWQRAILAAPRQHSASHQEAGGPSLRPNANGSPAKPQYPLRLLRLSRPIAGLPSPHHAAGPLASEELAPHQAMDVRKEFPVHHVPETGHPAWIGAIECQGSRSPAKPDHRAPFRGFCIQFSHQHAGFSLHMTASFERVWLDAVLSPQKCPNQACFKQSESVVRFIVRGR